MDLQGQSSADLYVDNVVRWCRRVGTDPVSWVRLHDVDPKEFDNVSQAMVNEMMRRNMAAGSIDFLLTCLRAWLDWNRLEFGRRLIIGRAPVRPIAGKQSIPPVSGARRAFDATDTHGRNIMGLRCFAGLRPGILGNKAGTDGLVLADMDGLTLVDGRPVVEEDHLIIRVRASLSKNDKPFFTLIGAEGIDYLVAELNRRVDKGEVLAPDSPVVVPLKRHARSGRFLKRNSILDKIRRAMDAAGIDSTTYIWRHYFKTHLLPAQGKKGLVPEYVEFWMGHFNGIQSTYSFDKALPPEVMADIVHQYRTIAVQYLETRPHKDQDGGINHIAVALLRSVGVTDDDLAHLDLEDPDHDALETLVQERLQARLNSLTAPEASVPGPAPEPAQVAPKGPQQALVRIEDVGLYLEAGWIWRTEAPAPAGQALVEAPAGTPTPLGPATTGTEVAA